MSLDARSYHGSDVCIKRPAWLLGHSPSSITKGPGKLLALTTSDFILSFCCSCVVLACSTAFSLFCLQEHLCSRRSLPRTRSLSCSSPSPSLGKPLAVLRLPAVLCCLCFCYFSHSIIQDSISRIKHEVHLDPCGESCFLSKCPFRPSRCSFWCSKIDGRKGIPVGSESSQCFAGSFGSS